MPFTLLHEYFPRGPLTIHVDTHDDLATVHCSLSGELPIRFPGKLIIDWSATYTVKIYVVEQSRRGGEWRGQPTQLPLTIEIRTPDGQLFTADHVTLDDLSKFRDRRGSSQGVWTFHLEGEKKDIPVIKNTPPQEGDSSVEPGKAYVRIAVEEIVGSKSAPPLVLDTVPAPETRRYTFDLFRVGMFVASARSRHGLFGLPTGKRLTLYDSNGAPVAQGGGGLEFPITLQTLDNCRDADGNPRLWTLEAGETVGPVSGSSPDVDVDVSATVIAETRISTHVLQDRINVLIGERGKKISIYAEERSRDLLVRLKILDEVSAESIDMWGLLDSRIGSVPQDEGVTEDIAKGVAYNLYNKSRYLKDEDGKKLYVRLYDMKVTYLDISIGASVKIQPSIPALKLDVGVEGHAVVKVLVDDLGFDLATVKVRNSHISFEAGLRADGNGSFVAETWIDEDLLDIDLATAWTDQVAITIASLGLLNVVSERAVLEWLEGRLNSEIGRLLHDVVAGAMNAPQILAILLGDDFTYRDVRMDGEDIVFSYVAPLEPDPKPSEGYVGIIGRSAVQTGPTTWDITPPLLGDTWGAQNLAKIDHIVMVMMENRSFNHVLGYRAQLAGIESDGLTQELIDFLNSLEFDITEVGGSQTKFPTKKLKDSDIPENSVGKKTALPCHVGHSWGDVAEQLMVSDPSRRHIQTPAGRWINNPLGFIKNFNEERAHGFARENVLGYYEGDDLPFFRFLAKNYAYCERFFCSHPGPTLPNRMFSLGGDVQYDRTGEAILNNNHGDNFYLSRALNIFDLLHRKGIAWRMYESPPSISMLRMFARYAGDNTNIVPLGEHASRLREDAAGRPETFPSVVFIDPAFHHHPQNDDHAEDARERPAVDMWRGQQFLRDIYEALVSNRELWLKTLLIITYDEHGGFYDHVIPPLAEGLFAWRRTGPFEVGRGGTSSMTIPYGVRVPTFVVSPWVPAGKGPDIVLDFCSILKTIIARFLGTQRHRMSGGGPGRRETTDTDRERWVTYYTYPFLTDRVHASRSFDAYLSAVEPRLDVEPSPVMAPLAPGPPPRGRTPGRGRAIITDVVSRAQMRRGNVTFHDLTGRLARQLGR